MDGESNPAAGLSIHQLALPLTSAPTPAVAAVPAVPPAGVWATLSPAARQQLTGTVRRVFAEVGRDTDRG